MNSSEEITHILRTLVFQRNGPHEVSIWDCNARSAQTSMTHHKNIFISTLISRSSLTYLIPNHNWRSLCYLANKQETKLMKNTTRRHSKTREAYHCPDMFGLSNVGMVPQRSSWRLMATPSPGCGIGMTFTKIYKSDQYLTRC